MGRDWIKKRVLLRPACDSPVLKHFSPATDPEHIPWNLTNRRSDPLPGRVQKPNNWIKEQASTVRPPPWCLPSPAWEHTVVKQNILCRKNPSSSTGKCRQEHAERILQSFSHGESLWSQKSCGSRPGQVRTCLTRKKGLNVSHFRNWDHALLFMDKHLYIWNLILNCITQTK
jgi:hypothetical protein